MTQLGVSAAARRRLTAAWAAAILFALLAFAAPASAAAKRGTGKEHAVAPDREGLVHACYGHTDRRELHLVAEGEGCNAHELSLTWGAFGTSALININSGTTVDGSNITVSAAEDKDPAPVVTVKDDDPSAPATMTDDDDGSGFPGWVAEATKWVGAGGLLIIAAALALTGLARLVGVGVRWLARRSRRFRRTRFARWFGATLQIEPFVDKAIKPKLGLFFAETVQRHVIRPDGFAGMNLYVETGESNAATALADLKEVPQAGSLAVALTLIRLGPWRRRLVASGSLAYGDDGHTILSTVVSLRLGRKLIGSAEFWPPEHAEPALSATTANRLLALQAAAWIEYRITDQNLGPPARDVFRCKDAVSWALLRAGSELTRLGYVNEAADYLERALALDGSNVGALIDVAHIRRLEDQFEPAALLAYTAIDGIAGARRHARRSPIRRIFRQAMHTLKAVTRKSAPSTEQDGGQASAAQTHGVDTTNGYRVDPSWYRAHIVLATAFAEWAKSLERQARARVELATERTAELKDELRSEVDAKLKAKLEAELDVARVAELEVTRVAKADEERAGEHRDRALRVVLEVASAAMATGSWLDAELSRRALPRLRDPIRRAFPWLDGRPRRGALEDAARANGTAGLDKPGAASLRDLLRTTFEPGSLLLVAANCDRREERPDLTASIERRYSEKDRWRRPLDDRVNHARKPAEGQIASAAIKARPGGPKTEYAANVEPRVLLIYIRTLPRKSPRVIYNLACFYSVAAARAKAGSDEARRCLDIAKEALRQAIARSTPRERRGLLAHAEWDPDLTALRDADEVWSRELEEQLP